VSSTDLTITSERLEDDFHRAGVTEGDVLIVHSSLRAVGWLEGGPDAMLVALRRVLRPAGTLIMPTFSFNLVAWNLPDFEPWHTPSRVGKLTDRFWRQDGVRRTAHPTHSVAAWGRYAAQVTAGNIDYEPLGVGSPLDRARKLGAKILLVGVGHNRNSSVHVAEALADMPYLRVPFSDTRDHDEARYVPQGNSRAKKLAIRQMPGSSEGFSKLDQLFLDEGLVDPIMIGNALSTIMSSAEICDRVVDILRKDPLFFLLGPDQSEISHKRAEYMRRHLAG
jgi:aminoglycoside 3-N-acetyltransferase